MKIELSQQDAQVLLNLINIAVKSTGLEAAQAGLYFQQKINQAAKEEAEKKEVTEE